MDTSAALFGNSHLLDVVLAVQAQDKVATTRQLASSLGLPDSVIRPVLGRLVTAGALQPLPRTGGRRSPLFFEAQDNELWRALVALATAGLHQAKHQDAASTGPERRPTG